MLHLVHSGTNTVKEKTLKPHYRYGERTNRKIVHIESKHSHIAISPLDWGIQAISTERRPQGTPKPAG